MKRTHERSLGPMLKKRRASLGLTQPMLAEALGYSTSQFVSQWERGRCEVPPGKLPIIAEILDLSLPKLVKQSIESYATEFHDEVNRCQLTQKQRQSIRQLKAKVTTGRKQRLS